MSYPVHPVQRCSARDEHFISIKGCKLFWTVERARAWWRVETQGQDATECNVLDDRLRPGWVALSQAARRHENLARTLNLVVAFHLDEPSVERWFRYQASSKEVQAILQRTNERSMSTSLAAQLMISGAMSRFEGLLNAMGYGIDDVSLEKVSAQRPAGWASEFPRIREWDLPTTARLALPLATWLTISDLP